MRTLFGAESPNHILISPRAVEPDRSPFMRERLEVLYEGDTLTGILEQVRSIAMNEATFKVIFVKMNDLAPSHKIEFDEQRIIERSIGMHIEGEADVHNPDYVFGIMTLGGRWYFGNYIKSKAVWLHHMDKPRNYSIALTTRVARAIANIAVPSPAGVTAIDPCCGIGTVLIEALSMGINIVGRDINPFVVRGTLENMAHFGLNGDVTMGDIGDVTASYDAAVIDMPYNHYSRTTQEDQSYLLQQARRIAARVIVVTAESMDELIADAGFTIIDRGTVRKGSFLRHIIVCS